MKTALAALYSILLSTGLAAAQAPDAPAPDWDTPDWDIQVSADLARSDLQALYQGLQSAHYDLYVQRPRAEYDALYEKTYAKLAKPLTRFELLLELQKFTAYGNVAHARIDFPSDVFDDFRAEGGRTFPLYLRIIEGRAYVGENYAGVAGIAAGDEILSVNGAPMAEWLERTSAYISADTPYIAHSLLEFWFPRLLWVEAGEQDAFRLRLRSDGGPINTVNAPARTREEITAASEATSSASADDDAPRRAKMLTQDIAYLRPGPFYNFETPERMWDNSAFLAFINDAFEGFIAADADALLIDLRDNPGGDNSFSDLMISWIANREFRFASNFLIRSSDEAAASNQARLDANPDAAVSVSQLFADAYAITPRGETFKFDIPYAAPRNGPKFHGDVYVLINRHSYSNAVNVAAIFQDYGWGTILGEKTADMATTYGAMEQFTLPGTGFTVGFPKAHIIRPSGDTKVDGVTPDLLIRTPIVTGPTDIVLDHALAIIELLDED